MSWKFHLAAIVQWINIRGGRVIFVIEDYLAPFAFHARHHSLRRRRWVSVFKCTNNGCHDTRCPSDRRRAIVRWDTNARSEGAACVWTATNETVSSSHAWQIM
ncbi:hypothetical protein TNCV_2787081 [Trichonephila clavipes]|nr:hypothetical protein TNCV_2787081 [Trichonephila clavipes]